MKITHKILNIPPYISTSWENIKLLALDGPNLVIVLQNESRVIIPNIDKNTLTAIFDAHAKSLEEKTTRGKIDFSFGLPLQGALPGLEALPNAMQHNPEQANMPDLPEEVLGKISALSKIMNFEDPNVLPKAEASCNCVHCQLARALQGATKNGNTKALEEEKVTEEDLKFRSWDIKQTAEKQYTVSNPFNKDEKYNVFLGEPIGCTCGSDKCAHIQAVLKS